MLRTIRWIASLLVLLLVFGWGMLWVAGAYPNGSVAALVKAVRGAGGPGSDAATGGLAGVHLGGPFTMVDAQGQTVTDANFRGRWMLLYFGYTYCPDVCPTELQAVSAALDRLGPDAAKIAPIFVTIDPDRDTPKVMADYVRLFDPRLIGLTGTPAQVHDIASAYRVYYAKVTPKGATDYLMDHSSFLYLMSPDGSFRALLRPGGTAAELAASIERGLHG